MALASVGDAITQLAGLAPNPPSSLSAGLGGQNFTHCCLVALNESLTIEDGNLSYASPSFIAPGLSMAGLEAAVAADEFPCGATFNGDVGGAPVVAVPYAWCATRCPGWEMSHYLATQQWIGPLVQFIVPSLAFCANVPRTRKLRIPDVVFGAHPRTLVGFASYWVRLLGALLLVTVDTFLWLAICFAFAGPMLLSAVYEYALDRKVLEFLAPPKERPPSIPLRLRAQLLLAVVVGNVRMAALEQHEAVVNGRHDSDVSDAEGKILAHNSIWKKVMAMVDEDEASRMAGRRDADAVSLPTKLKSLLNSQTSPSTLEAIVYDGGKVADPDKYEMSFWAQHIKRAKAHKYAGFIIRRIEGYSLLETAFEGRFRTVKLWKRGLNKRQWVQEAVDEYTMLVEDRRREHGISPSKLRDSLTLNAQDCSYVFVSTLLLLLIPCALAFLVSYNTPTAGLSCRSLTYLIYAISQVCEMALWTWAARLRIKYGARWSEKSPVAKRICWWGQVFVGFFAVFAAVGGTLMQLLGVYRSCACKVPARYWLQLDNPDVYVVLSNNAAGSIDAALKWWTTIGNTAVGVLVVVCALAWWHQRRLRKVFRDEADKLVGDPVTKDMVV